MKGYRLRGDAVPGGDPLLVAEVQGAFGDWTICIEPLWDPTTHLLTDVAFTRWGARRVATRWLRRLA